VNIIDVLSARIQELIRELSNKNEDVWWGAAYTLARIGQPAVDSLIPDLMTRKVLSGCGQPGHSVRSVTPRALDPPIFTLRDGDWAIRMRVAEAPGKHRARTAVDALLLMLRDEKSDVRRHAIAALTLTADPASAIVLAIHSKTLTGV
jgi:HEAT repeat protein